MDDKAEVGRRKRRAERDDSLGDDEEEGAREAASQPENSEVKETSGNEKVAEAEAKTPTSDSVCPTSTPELAPTCVTQSISGSTIPEKESSLLNMDQVLKPKPDKNGSAQTKALTVKTTVPDRFSWRKYGQKQVKSPKGSRSYYRCTFSECCAKKIELSDDSGHVIEIINKGIHCHDAPRKKCSIRESRVGLSPGQGTSSISERKSFETPIPDPPSSSKEPLVEDTIISERKRQSSSLTESAEFMDIQIKEDYSVGPDPKRRAKKGTFPALDLTDKSGKKPKVFFYATADVAVSGDGYRWRKYGQKMVKGNPHPRNYYRCTSAGCPMRKQIERAIDNSNGVIITYKGDHDHVVPVPKKRHAPRSAPLIAAAPASMNSVQHEVTSTPRSLGKEGKVTSETLDVKGEKDKTVESAQTLLSMGFEIKQC